MDLEIVFLFIFALTVTAFSRWRNWSSPLTIVAVACLVSFIPKIPNFELDAKIIFTLILPPLLYSAALDSSYLDLKSSAKPIFSLGILLVFFTTAAVAVVAHFFIPNLAWSGAILLGAIVAPPDAVSAATIGRKLGLPKRIMTVLSGESLINDAASLTLFKTSMVIVAGSTLTLQQEIGVFFQSVSFGIMFGLLIGWVVHALRMRLHDPLIESVFGLLVPFAAYLLADHFNGSGVLAVVAAGLYLGFTSPYAGHASRLQENYVWDSLTVLLEAFVFALIGLQLKPIVLELVNNEQSIWVPLGTAGVVLLTVIVIRPLFVFTSYNPKRNQNFSDKNVPYLSWKDKVIISWAGMRGVVTLAAAASIPATSVFDNTNFDRNNIFLIAFFVTVGTLLLQGMTLPHLSRKLHVGDPLQEEKAKKTEAKLLKLLLEESLQKLELDKKFWVTKYGQKLACEVIDKVVVEVKDRKKVVTKNLAEQNKTGTYSLEKMQLYAKIQHSLLVLQRNILVEERNAGRLEEEVMREMLREIDFKEAAASSSWITRL